MQYTQAQAGTYTEIIVCVWDGGEKGVMGVCVRILCSTGWLTPLCGLKMTLHFWSSCLLTYDYRCLPYTQFYVTLGIKPSVMCMLEKYSTNQAQPYSKNFLKYSNNIITFIHLLCMHICEDQMALGNWFSLSTMHTLGGQIQVRHLLLLTVPPHWPIHWKDFLTLRVLPVSRFECHVHAWCQKRPEKDTESSGTVWS